MNGRCRSEIVDVGGGRMRSSRKLAASIGGRREGEQKWAGESRSRPMRTGDDRERARPVSADRPVRRPSHLLT
jgi:hypothetical protein